MFYRTPFTWMENGVKQGGVLSSILFCVYFDELLKRLESSGMGCYIGHHFYGCVGYADDVKLLCPSINGLQSMINFCEIFADEFDVTFNTKKTLCICYGSDNNATLRQVSLNGVKIPWQSTVKHLGNVLMYNLHDEADVYKKRGDFIAAVNKMNSVFTSVNAKLKLSLLQTYCASWYGCQAWQLGTPYCDLMDIEWRKAVRRTAGLPRQTRSVLLPGLSQQERRFARLSNTMSASNNPAICFLATRAALSAIGVLGRNRVYLAYKYQCGRLSKGLLVPPWCGVISDEAPRVEQIRELVRARDELAPIDILEPEDIALVLEFITTYWMKYI